MELLRKLSVAENVGYSMLQARAEASGEPSAFKESPWGMVAFYGVLAVFGYAFYRRSMSHAEKEEKARKFAKAIKGGKSERLSWAEGVEASKIDAVNELMKESLRSVDTVEDPRVLEAMFDEFQLKVGKIVGDKSPAVQGATDFLLGQVLVELQRHADAAGSDPESRERRVQYLGTVQNLAIGSWSERVHKDALALAEKTSAKGGKLLGLSKEEYANELLGQTMTRVIRDLPSLVQKSEQEGIPLFEVVRAQIPRAAEEMKSASERGGFTGFTNQRYRDVKTAHDLLMERGTLQPKTGAQIASGELGEDSSLDEVAPGIIVRRTLIEKPEPGTSYVVSYRSNERATEVMSLGQRRAALKFKADDAIRRSRILRDRGDEDRADDLLEKAEEYVRQESDLAEQMAKIEKSGKIVRVFPQQEDARRYYESIKKKSDVFDLEPPVERKTPTTLAYSDPKYYVAYTEIVTEQVDDDDRARRMGLHKSKNKRDLENDIRRYLKGQDELRRIESGEEDLTPELKGRYEQIQRSLAAIASSSPQVLEEIKARPKKALEQALIEAMEMSEDEEAFADSIEGPVKKGDEKYPKILITKKVDNFYEVPAEHVAKVEKIIAAKREGRKVDGIDREVLASIVMENPTVDEVEFFKKSKGKVPQKAKRRAPVVKEWSKETLRKAAEKGVELPSQNAYERVTILGRQELDLGGQVDVKDRFAHRHPSTVLSGKSLDEMIETRELDDVSGDAEEAGSRFRASKFAEAVIDKIDDQKSERLTSRSRILKKYPDLVQLFERKTGEIDEEGLNALLLSGDLSQLKKGRNEGRQLLFDAEYDRLFAENPGWSERRLAAETERALEERIKFQLGSLTEDLSKATSRGEQSRRYVARVLSTEPSKRGVSYVDTIDQWLSDQYFKGKKRPGKGIFQDRNLKQAAYARVRSDLEKANAAIADENVSDAVRLDLQKLINEATAFKSAIESTMEPDMTAVDAIKSLSRKIDSLQDAIDKSGATEETLRMKIFDPVSKKVVTAGQAAEAIERFWEERDAILRANLHATAELAFSQYEREKEIQASERKIQKLETALERWKELYKQDLTRQGYETPFQYKNRLEKLRNDLWSTKSEIESIDQPREMTLEEKARSTVSFEIPFAKNLGIEDVDAEIMGRLLDISASPNDAYTPETVSRVVERLRSPQYAGSYTQDLEEEISSQAPSKGRLGEKIVLDRDARKQAILQVKLDLVDAEYRIEELRDLARRDPLNQDRYEEAIGLLVDRMKDAAQVEEAIEAQDYLDLLRGLETVNDKSPTLAQERALKNVRFKWGPKEIEKAYQEAVFQKRKADELLGQMKAMQAASPSKMSPQDVERRNELLAISDEAIDKIEGIKDALAGKKLKPRSLKHFQGIEPTIELIAGGDLLDYEEFVRAFEVPVGEDESGVYTDEKLANIAYNRFKSGQKKLAGLFGSLGAKIKLQELGRGVTVAEKPKVDVQKKIEEFERLKQMPVGFAPPPSLSPKTVQAQQRFIEITREITDKDKPQLKALRDRLDYVTRKPVAGETFIDPYVVSATPGDVYDITRHLEKEIEFLKSAMDSSNEQDIKDARLQILLDPRSSLIDPAIEDEARGRLSEVLASYNDASRGLSEASQALKEIDQEIQKKGLSGAMSIASEYKTKYKRGTTAKASAPLDLERSRSKLGVEEYGLLRSQRFEKLEQQKKVFDAANRSLSRLIGDEATRKKVVDLYQSALRGRSQAEKQTGKERLEKEISSDLTVPEYSDMRTRMVKTPKGFVKVQSEGPTSVIAEIMKNLALEKLGYVVRSPEESRLESAAERLSLLDQKEREVRKMLEQRAVMVKKSEAPAKTKKPARMRVSAVEGPKVRVSEEAETSPEEVAEETVSKTRAS